jgi:diketogulonate reductase-like aldo/keto reductase
MEHDDRDQAIAALRAGLELGLTHVDTAEMYGAGVVEEVVADAIDGRRDEVFLASKVLPRNASRAGTIAACERSLRRLRTDRLDLYMLHWPGPHALEDTIAAFEELRAAGKVRAWGVSNFDVPDLERAVAIAGEGRVACNQVLYHLEAREIEAEVLPFCEAHRIAVVGYSPFATGHFPPSAAAPRRALSEIARAHDTTVYAVALAFLTRRPSLFAIPKAARAAHARDNATAAALRLTPAELAQLDAAF